jgi:hypothetical protein
LLEIIININGLKSAIKGDPQKNLEYLANCPLIQLSNMTAERLKAKKMKSRGYKDVYRKPLKNG